VLTWQIIPSILPDLIIDLFKAEMVMKVLKPIKKLEIKKLEMA
jgi:predicted 3-demethylubiquinone-9 3-methyltransferase (glyoxalase superfamily)